MEHHSQSEKLAPYGKEKAKVLDLETKLKQLDLIINSIQHASYETGREIRSSLRQLEDETEGIGQLLDDVKCNPETETGDDFSVDIKELEDLYNERFAEKKETRTFLNQGNHLMFPTVKTSEVYSKGHTREYESESFEEAQKHSVFYGLGEQPPKHMEALVSRLETIGITWDELKGAIET